MSPDPTEVHSSGKKQGQANKSIKQFYSKTNDGYLKPEEWLSPGGRLREIKL